ncbi:MAG: hypothetical protein JXB10_11955 [Pirellulales bacterium]|nr:hypothetical protein [Pirellulales bacterium]
MTFPKIIGGWFRRGIFLLPAMMIYCPAFAAETPIYEQDPYDVVTLKEPGENQVLKVLPLDLPERKVPERTRPGVKIRLRFYDDPGKLFEVDWTAIKDVDFFEQRILKQAGELAAAGKFEDVYNYLCFLREKYPKTPGLGKGWEDALYEEAKVTYSRGEYDGALALLREVYARNPKRPELEKALGMATEKLVSGYMAQKRYAAARIILDELRSEFPEHPTVTAWTERLKAEAAQAFQAAETAAQSGDWSAADRNCLLLGTIWPDYPGAKKLAETIHSKYPRVAVGVMTPWSPRASNRLADEALRRTSRLCYRTLTEYLGPGAEGGQYRCPLGEIRRENLGRKLLVRLQPDIRTAGGGAALTGYDLAHRLREMTRPGDPDYSPAWSELLQSLQVKDVYTVEAELRHSSVCPEALLQTPVVPQDEGPPVFFQAPADGPFRLPASSPAAKAEDPSGKAGAEITFTVNPDYFAAQPGQLQQIVERYYTLSANAVSDLKHGQLQAVDRVPLWELPRLQEEAELAVGRYAVPRVHCLIPNLRRPLVSERTFRRALVYGINREAILKQLVGPQPVEGCCLLSGPFPAGSGLDDPLSYAYDVRIAPRPYDPRLALALAASEALAAKEDGAKEKSQTTAGPPPKANAKPAAPKEKGPRTIATLTLAYPDDEVIRVACTSIKKQLAVLGLKIELRPFTGPVPEKVPEDADLLYVALVVGEPAADAGAILGESGMTGGGSPYLRLALRQLDEATNWEEAQRRLYRIHRLAHEEVAVIPLWQLYDFYVYRKGLNGIGRNPVSLYQNIEQWQAPLEYSAEKK